MDVQTGGLSYTRRNLVPSVERTMFVGHYRMSVAAGLLVGLFATLRAQPESRLVGRVSDACGAVFPGVTITVNGESRRATAHTDSSGRFEVAGLQAGVYTVVGQFDWLRHDHAARTGTRCR